MKKTILSIVIAATFAACSSNTKQAEESTAQQQFSSNDTAGLAEYQNWKQQKEQLQPIDMQGVGDIVESNTVPPVASAAPVQAKTQTRVIYRDRPAKAQRTVTYKQPEVKYEEPDYTVTKPTGQSREAVSRNGSGVGSGSGEGTSGVGAGTDVGVGSGPAVVSTPAPVPAKKEGWSKAAKGTAIGAASGAVLGAVLSKNKGMGAVIGGVVGGAGGYIIGRAKDKKDGRYLVASN